LLVEKVVKIMTVKYQFPYLLHSHKVSPQS
jgi:hypothetical protein